MNQDFTDTIPTEWAASASTEIGADQSERVEPGMQMIGVLLMLLVVGVALLAASI
jgi:hypothetical protein